MDRLWGEPGWGTALLFALFIDLATQLLYAPTNVYFFYVLRAPARHVQRHAATLRVDVVQGQPRGRHRPDGRSWSGLYGLARRVRRWWLVLGVPVALLMLVSSALDPYRARLYFDQTPLPEGPLRSSITALMRKADITFSDVVVEKTSVTSKRIQAYFAGQGPTRTIVLNDVILKELGEDEILAAVAHEAGHVNEPRWPGRIALRAGAAGPALPHRPTAAPLRPPGLVGRPRARETSAPCRWCRWWSPSSSCSRLPCPAALSREREREADRYGLALTGDPGAFRRMLVKAARVNKMDPEPPRWVVLKGMSHPPIGERLAALDTP